MLRATKIFLLQTVLRSTIFTCVAKSMRCKLRENWYSQLLCHKVFSITSCGCYGEHCRNTCDDKECITLDLDLPCSVLNSLLSVQDLASKHEGKYLHYISPPFLVSTFLHSGFSCTQCAMRSFCSSLWRLICSWEVFLNFFVTLKNTKKPFTHPSQWQNKSLFFSSRLRTLWSP